MKLEFYRSFVFYSIDCLAAFVYFIIFLIPITVCDKLCTSKRIIGQLRSMTLNRQYIIHFCKTLQMVNALEIMIDLWLTALCIIKVNNIIICKDSYSSCNNRLCEATSHCILWMLFWNWKTPTLHPLAFFNCLLLAYRPAAIRRIAPSAVILYTKCLHCITCIKQKLLWRCGFLLLEIDRDHIVSDRRLTIKFIHECMIAVPDILRIG